MRITVLAWIPLVSTLAIIGGCDDASDAAMVTKGDEVGGERGTPGPDGVTAPPPGESMSTSGEFDGVPMLDGADAGDGDFIIDDSGMAAAGGAGGAPNEPDWPSDPIDLPQPPHPEPGQLTAGIWDDNANFSFFERYQTSRLGGQQTALPGALPLDPEAQSAAAAAVQDARAPKQRLDAALVIDTTGSMSDELEYLKVEFEALHASILDRYPKAEQRWALVLYRDEGDAYVVRDFDFTSEATTYQQALAAQSSDGGGDTPESPDLALDDAAGLSWRTEAETARVLFWVADAPHHDERAEAMLDAVFALQDAGVHVYPVASSGVDELTELTMRQTAQLTFGRYLFLTDDSGIGNSHEEPTVPCYFVRLLSDSVLRVVDAEMTGSNPEANLEEVIRVGGEIDQDGYCIYGSTQRYRPF
jgi:hypothetical protein